MLILTKKWKNTGNFSGKQSSLSLPYQWFGLEGSPTDNGWQFPRLPIKLDTYHHGWYNRWLSQQTWWIWLHLFSTEGFQYNRVCGKVICHQNGTADALNFLHYNEPRGIEEPYVDGASLTYGSPGYWHHVWTFGSAFAET